MFNDYGSVSRDAAERNLSSINFPEFFEQGIAHAEKGVENGKRCWIALRLLNGKKYCLMLRCMSEDVQIVRWASCMMS
jgi:hypothetical protein